MTNRVEHQEPTEIERYPDGTILWQECEDCEVGWSPELGFHELEEIEG